MHFTTKYNGPIQRKTWGAEQAMEGLARELIMVHKGVCHKTVPNSGGAHPFGPTIHNPVSLLADTLLPCTKVKINGVIKINKH